jgi:hypothetical protein
VNPPSDVMARSCPACVRRARHRRRWRWHLRHHYDTPLAQIRQLAEVTAAHQR